MPTTRSQAAKEAALLDHFSRQAELEFPASASQDSTLVLSDVEIPESPSTESSGRTELTDPDISRIATTSDTLPAKLEGLTLEPQSPSLSVVSPRNGPGLLVVLEYGKKNAKLMTPWKIAPLLKRGRSLVEADGSASETGEESDLEYSRPLRKRQTLKMVTIKTSSTASRRTRTTTVRREKVDGQFFDIKEEVDKKSESYSDVEESISSDSGIRSRLRSRKNAGIAGKGKPTSHKSRSFLSRRAGISKRVRRSSFTKNLRANLIVEKREQKSLKEELSSARSGLKIKFTLPKKKIIYRRTKPEGGWAENQYRHTLGYSPFVDIPGPTPEACETIFMLLQEFHLKNGDPINFSRSMHTCDELTIDAVVQVLLSQATDNDNAIKVHDYHFCNAYPYTDANGAKVVTKIPNYHDVRTGSVEKLGKAIEEAGLYKERAANIKRILDDVHNANYDRLTPEEKKAHVDGNPPDAKNFVPGLLSFDYLKDVVGDEDQALYNHFARWRGVGPKSTCCILAFGLERDVFAVDTHVHRFVRMLLWVPQSWNADLACMHLDAHVPKDLKYKLHQAFWHHGQRCVRCRGDTSPSSKGWAECVCPIEEYLDRSIPPFKRGKSAASKRRKSSDSSSPAKSSQGLSPKKSPPKGKAKRKVIGKIEIVIHDDFSTNHGNRKSRTKLIYGDLEDNTMRTLPEMWASETGSNISTDAHSAGEELLEATAGIQNAQVSADGKEVTADAQSVAAGITGEAT